jgi:DNA mismatch endonuclease, patch repair protein
MAAIRSKNTTPEMTVRRFLHAAGLRYRLHRSDLPGRPDIVLPRYQAAVLVHGCFWHHHGCKNSVWPRTRSAFWRAKITGNIQRDRRNVRALRKLGWRVFLVWECETSSQKQLEQLCRAVTKREARARGSTLACTLTSSRDSNKEK